jgi:hypothetical protein
MQTCQADKDRTPVKPGKLQAILSFVATGQLERSAWRRSAGSTMSKAVPHSHYMMFAFKLIHLGLLVGCKGLVKRSLRLSV